MTKLHIGCGKRLFNGYVNIDLYESVADVQADAADTGYTKNSVDEILSIHVIEHIEPEHFDRALNHWHDILKPDGMLKLRCPNAVVYIKEWLAAYEQGNTQYLNDWGRINMLGHSKHAGTLNRQLFTLELLEMKLKKAGFEVLECKVGETRPEQRNTFEYRANGDIHCTARPIK